MNQLNTDGYIHIKNIINPTSLGSCINTENKADYHCVQNFIQNELLSKVNILMGWDCDYIKFRLSDNNNSSDASVFHRDIIAQKDVLYPSFTCLTYLDTTVMEVIPGTHTQLFSSSFVDAVTTFRQRRRIVIESGDILLFYSTLLHRGIFTENLPHRRLLQVFEVFPTKELLMVYKDRFLHVKGGSGGHFVSAISKFSIIEVINISGYLNSFYGYGVMKGLPHNISYLSSEGLRPRLEIHNHPQELNCYIMNHETIDSNDRFMFNLFCFQTQSMILILMIILLILFFYIIIRLIIITEFLK